MRWTCFVTWQTTLLSAVTRVLVSSWCHQHSVQHSSRSTASPSSSTWWRFVVRLSVTSQLNQVGVVFVILCNVFLDENCPTCFNRANVISGASCRYQRQRSQRLLFTTQFIRSSQGCVWSGERRGACRVCPAVRVRGALPVCTPLPGQRTARDDWTNSAHQHSPGA